MPPLLVRPGRLLVAALVVSDHHADLPGRAGSPPAAEPRRAPGVQRSAHLFHRHLRIFPPAVGPCGSTRSPSRSGTGSGGGSAPHTAAPRSGSAPPPSSPRENSV